MKKLLAILLTLAVMCYSLTSKNIAFSVHMFYNTRACGHLLRENIKSGRRRKK